MKVDLNIKNLLKQFKSHNLKDLVTIGINNCQIYQSKWKITPRNRICIYIPFNSLVNLAPSSQFLTTITTVDSYLSLKFTLISFTIPTWKFDTIPIRIRGSLLSHISLTDCKQKLVIFFINSCGFGFASFLLMITAIYRNVPLNLHRSEWIKLCSS